MLWVRTGYAHCPWRRSDAGRCAVRHWAPSGVPLWIGRSNIGILSCVVSRLAVVGGLPGLREGSAIVDGVVTGSKLGEIVERLRQAYAPERIYLFGSHARGDAGPDSDFDILVVVSDDAPPNRRTSRLAYQALRGTGVAADVLVWTRGYFEGRRHLKASLSATVSSEGRLLYAA